MALRPVALFINGALLFLSVSFLWEVAAPASARACSCQIVEGSLWQPETVSSDDFPSNGLLFGDTARSSTSWNVEARRDEILSALSESTVWQIEGSAGDVITRAGCESCDLRLVVGDEDLESPSAAELLNVRINYVVVPEEEGLNGCVADSLEFEMRASDDRTSADSLLTLVYTAATREELAAITAPSGLFTYSPQGKVVTTLGRSDTHARDEGPLRQAGPFCFAVAAMDRAGNVGERSGAVCLDTTDPSDPLIQLGDFDPPCSGIFCTVSPGTGQNSPGLWWAAGFVGLWFVRRGF
ncbi:MAG: MYXO-CTERM domain-containing protein [Polyangiales bacterium]|jgi:MYXO-CTERM domain-containing protein